MAARPPRPAARFPGPIIVRDVFQIARDMVLSSAGFVVSTAWTPSRRRAQLDGRTTAALGVHWWTPCTAVLGRQLAFPKLMAKGQAYPLASGEVRRRVLVELIAQIDVFIGGTKSRMIERPALARGWPRPAPPACPRRGSEQSPGVAAKVPVPA